MWLFNKLKIFPDNRTTFTDRTPSHSHTHFIAPTDCEYPKSPAKRNRTVQFPVACVCQHPDPVVRCLSVHQFFADSGLCRAIPEGMCKIMEKIFIAQTE